MKKIRIGILAPSEIAYRRFLPSLKESDNIEYVGVAVASIKEWFGDTMDRDMSIIDNEYKKAQTFLINYGGIIFDGYENFIKSDLIDAIYIPLPPSLHFKWAKLALENNIHVLVEKPSTVDLAQTNELVALAKENKLALHENYMFVFHKQIDFIKDYLESGLLGEIRLVTIDFGFPFRGINDFRYSKKLGGGALFDCGGYTIKLASLLLGRQMKIISAISSYKDNIDVDIFGSATLINDKGLIARVSFGMDNSYKCDIDVWGSKGKLYSNRILTAPDDFKPIFNIVIDGNKSVKIIDSDSTFKKSIEYFHECILNENSRLESYDSILNQSYLVDQFIRKAKVNM